MKSIQLQTYCVTLGQENRAKLGHAFEAIRSAGGFISVACDITQRIVYSAERDLTAEIEAAIGGKVGDRVS